MHPKYGLPERLPAQKRSGATSTFNDEVFDSIQEAWSTMIRSDSTVARNYLHHLVEQIEVDENRITENRITVVPKEAFSGLA